MTACGKYVTSILNDYESRCANCGDTPTEHGIAESTAWKAVHLREKARSRLWGDAGGELVQIPGTVYDALLRLAAVHKRAVCKCENCPPDRAFPYDNCECGEDWSTCSDDVSVLDGYVPEWRGTGVHDT